MRGHFGKTWIFMYQLNCYSDYVSHLVYDVIGPQQLVLLPLLGRRNFVEVLHVSRGTRDVMFQVTPYINPGLGERQLKETFLLFRFDAKFRKLGLYSSRHDWLRPGRLGFDPRQRQIILFCVQIDSGAHLVFSPVG